jgi:hypothetical protein
MTTVLTFHLVRQSMGTPVRHNVRLDGAPSGQPGVTGIVVRDKGLGWCVLADHPANPGVSVTNGASEYARAVCSALDCDIGDLAWFEVDSDGKVDELHLLGAGTGFAPLLEDGQAPRSGGAFSARAAKLPGGLPLEAETTLAQCLGRFVR